jgi:hypothetical protein
MIIITYIFLPPLTSYSQFPYPATKIGLVMPTFTEGAYHNSFYLFYNKHQIWGSPAKFREPVHTDLNLLTAKLYKPGDGQTKPAVLLSSKIADSVFNSNVSLLTDADIDEGKTNGFDILIIFHQEYVTQREYDNFKSFVANGGTLICMDGNVFYAEVSHNKAANTITLLKGHGWTFNGVSARREGNYNQTIERWSNETSQWLGSNFLQVRFGETSTGAKLYRPVVFKNNPFGYKGGEEQQITNRVEKIILNYQAFVPNISKQPIVATYEKDYGKGKVLVFSLYTDNILSNADFNRFFNSLLSHYTSNINAT